MYQRRKILDFLHMKGKNLRLTWLAMWYSQIWASSLLSKASVNFSVLSLDGPLTNWLLMLKANCTRMTLSQHSQPFWRAPYSWQRYISKNKESFLQLAWDENELLMTLTGFIQFLSTSVKVDRTQQKKAFTSSATSSISGRAVRQFGQFSKAESGDASEKGWKAYQILCHMTIGCQHSQYGTEPSRLNTVKSSFFDGLKLLICRKDPDFVQ